MLGHHKGDWWKDGLAGYPHAKDTLWLQHLRRGHALWPLSCHRSTAGMLLLLLLSYFSRVQLFVTPWTAECQASLCITNTWCLSKLMSIESIDGHPAILSSVFPFSSPQSFPASESFQMSHFFESGGQSIGASVLPMNIRDWFPLGWTGWISLQSKGLSRVFSNTTVQKHQFFSAQLSLIVQVSHPHMTTGKNTALTRRTFAGKVMSLLFNMLSSFVIASLVAQLVKNPPAIW